MFQAGNNVDLDAELPPNAIADLFRLSRRAVREAVNAGRVRSHGRRRKVLVVCEFLEDVEELDPCRADECHDPALADNGGCGKAGHGRRGRSPSAEAAKASRRALDEAIAVLGAEKLIDVAPDCGVHPGTAIRAAREGSLQSPFKGPQDVWVVRREELQAELRQLKVDHPCKEPGCGRYVLLGEDYCYAHRGRGGRGKRTPEQKARMSAGALTRFEDQDQRDAVGEATRRRFEDRAVRKAAAERLQALLGNERDEIENGAGWTLEAIAADLLLTVDHIRELVRRGEIEAKRPGGVHRLLRVSERDYISFRHEYLVGSVDGNWRRELLRELWRDPDHVVKVEEKSGRLALRAQEWGVSEVEAARRIREEVTETNERLAPHRRGNKPQAGPSPIQEERYKAVVAARAELPDQVSGRQVRLHAARWAAANRPRLLPDDYVADGQLRCHCEESAIEMMARAENACKSPQRDLAAKPRP